MALATSQRQSSALRLASNSHTGAPTTPLTTRGPMGGIPYELLREIFIRCLPYPHLEFDNAMQPDAAAAPVLLCHVCSCWREIALAYPALWSHLSYNLTIVCGSRTSAWVLKEQLAFLSWWKANQRSIAPFLHLVVEWRSERFSDGEMVPLESPGAKFLSDYFRTAQYLKSDAMYWKLAQRWGKLGHRVRHPNLHTNIVKGQWFRHDAFYDFQAMAPSRCSKAPSMRRLAIGSGEVPDGFLTPSHWSALTHVSIDSVAFSLEFWYSLMRAAPDLQWAYFGIKELTGVRSYRAPGKYTLRRLSSLFVHCRQGHPNSEPMAFPLSLLFESLRLPALRTLSLSSRGPSWNKGNQGIAEIYGVLKSTPAVVTITLGEGFLPFGDSRCCNVPLVVPAGASFPAWTHLPCLTDLLLELPDASFLEDSEAVDEFDRYIQDALFRSGWMGLDTPACPIRRITLIDGHSWKGDFERIKGAMTRRIQQRAGKAPGITFKITSSLARLAPSRLQGA